jgi:protein CpxP
MKKGMTGWIMGGIFAISAVGLLMGTNVGSAAAKNADKPPVMQDKMMQNGQMDNKEMMNSPEMQKECEDMMKGSDMQKNMKEMMKQPEMQAAMKQMLASDPELRQMMRDLVNSVDANDQNDNPVPQSSTPATISDTVNHNAHHSS